MIDSKLFRIAVETAGTEDVKSAPDTVVLYSVSYQPTTANKDAALAFMRANPQMVMIDDTVCGRRLIELGFDWSVIDNDHDRIKAAEIWRLASRRFIDCASGNVTAFVDNADPRSVFRSEELPAILRNPKILTINGVDKFAFASSFEGLKSGGKVVLFETVKEAFFEEWMAKLGEVIDVTKIDYLVVNHTEPDHAGSVQRLLKLSPQLKIISTACAAGFLKEIVNGEFCNLIVHDNETMKIGEAYRISSPGWAGAYPWINLREGVYGFFIAHVTGSSSKPDGFSSFYGSPVIADKVSAAISKKSGNAVK